MRPGRRPKLTPRQRREALERRERGESVTNAAATFAVKIAGESMTDVGLFPGDIGVVDRSRAPADGSIVLSLLDGEFTIKRYRTKGGRVWLHAENRSFKDIEIKEGSDFEVWGVMSASIRKF